MGRKARRAAANQAASAARAAEPAVPHAWTERDRRYWPTVWTVVAIALLLRVFYLGVMTSGSAGWTGVGPLRDGPTYMHDEAIYSIFSHNFHEYNFDPVYHGPSLYHLIKLFFILSSDNDFSGRMVSVTMGMLLMWLVLGPGRRWMGARGALWCAGLIAISPVMVTYQRRILFDAFVMVLTLAPILCFQSAISIKPGTWRWRWAWIGLVSLITVFLATKANSFFVIAMLGSFWVLTRLRSLLPRDWPVKLPPDLPLITFFFLVAATIILADRDGIIPFVKTVSVPGKERLLQVLAVLCCAVLWEWLRRPAPEPRSVKRARAVTVPAVASASVPVATSESTVPAVAAEAPVEVVPVEEPEPSRWAWAAPKLAWIPVAILAEYLIYAQWLVEPRPPLAVLAGVGIALLAGVFLLPKPETKTLVLSLAAGAVVYAFLFGHGAMWPKEIGEALHAVNKPQALSGLAQKHLDEIRRAMPKMLEYWGGQQKAPRLPGRHDYYLPLLTAYELPILIAAIYGIFRAGRRRTRFTDLLLWWCFTTFTLYSIANEKVPWLATHFELPFLILAGWALGQLRFEKMSARAGFAVACILGAAYLLRNVVACNYQRALDNKETMFYAFTSESFQDTYFKAFQVAKEQNYQGDIWVYNAWPASWYMRHADVEFPGAAILYDETFPKTEKPLRLVVCQEPDFEKEKDGKFKGFHKWTWDPNTRQVVRDSGGENPYILLWPRISWTSLRLDKWVRWFVTRDAPLPEGDPWWNEHPDANKDDAFLTEWSHIPVVVATPD
jgi:predicted membrane-bound mannosyltransferase